MTKLSRSSPPPAGADARPRTLRLEALTLLVLSCGGASLSAGPLADPTRPPANLAAAAPAPTTAPAGASPTRNAADAAALAAARQATAAAAAAAAAADAAASPPPPPPLSPLADVVLQSVQSPARGPAVAIINGLLIKVGDTVAGRRVTRIDAQGVMLQSSAGHERLWLLGDNTKQAAGSIRASRSAQYTPAHDHPDAGAGGEATPRADRSSSPGALSLARRTQP